ncbi:hypothetical protein [Sphingobacterium hotanense]|uniref:LysM domain-containing protein n=1 Tax=Sphingobacterium hotanense TaxID=649196 RepID=A0ABT7NQY0_9SPHI|nr:hypothetical protein [Sphingobacterium hotanense]MDM1049373.1 hypothetical protein [Sphingobacterium hotanense]
MAEDKKEVKGAAAATPTPSQGEGTQAELVNHVVTESDLKHNPELAKNNIKVGDTVQLPADVKEKADARAKTEAAAKAKKAEEKASKASRKYLVVSPFADKDNFGKKWGEGDDVSHFSQERLQAAINRGLVKEG